MNTKAMDMIKELSDLEIKVLCHDIYNWENGNGDIDKNCALRKYIDNNKKVFYDIYFLRDLILNEALVRFEVMAKVLFVHYPRIFVK